MIRNERTDSAVIKNNNSAIITENIKLIDILHRVYMLLLQLFCNEQFYLELFHMKKRRNSIEATFCNAVCVRFTGACAFLRK